MKYIFNFFLFTYFSFVSLGITSDTESNAKLFGSLPDVSNVKISPNGKFVGVQQRTEETIVVKIIDLDKLILINDSTWFPIIDNNSFIDFINNYFHNLF